MDKVIILLAVICILSGTAAILLSRFRMKKTFERIEDMLDAAMENQFSETIFDESRLSALESRFANYLAASSTSASNVAAERDKVKTLISDISHQTKTPIANLLLYSELLSESELPEEVKGNVEAIHSQAKTLQFLIDSLVKMSRLENGILELFPQKEPVYPMLQALYDRFCPMAQEKGIDFRVETTEASAVFDPKWTIEALNNIVDNAIKYTDAGSVVLSTTLYEMFVCVKVTDTGSGIAEEDLPRIFSRFYRSESARTKEGVGVGLHLARNIIAKEGGYIKVSSGQGKGSCFSVFLPK